MEVATRTSLAVGKEALDILNDWLDDEQVAKSWYGEDHKTFTGTVKWPPRRAFRRLRITKVFTIKKDDWHKVIEQCLSDCYTWHRLAPGGECCWLPIFRSLPREMANRFLQSPETSLSSLSIRESLPAARIDLWGLVVLAFANGAEQTVRTGENGSFFAKLSAISFVLTIWQYDMAGPISAHLEPKEQGSSDRTMLTPHEWNNLLWSGHTFKVHDHIFGWPLSGGPLNGEPLNGEPPLGTPHDLTTNVLDGELAQIVMDDHWVQELQKQLRKVIYDCQECWSDILRENGLKNGWLWSDSRNGRLQCRIEEVQRRLWGLKLLLVDEDNTPDSIIQEGRPTDTLHYAKKQLAFVEQELRANDLTDKASRTKLETKILPLQKKIVALTRLLILPQKVTTHLSTRGTGTHVSLA